MTITQLSVHKDSAVDVYFLQKTQGDTNNERDLNNDNQEMEKSKGVYVNKHNVRGDQNLVYQLYISERGYTSQRSDSRSNFSCQYDSRKDNLICTCKNVVTMRKPQGVKYFGGVPKQIYAYHGSRSFTDIGVGSVKALPRRKVKRVYLPETDDRGIGSSDLSSYVTRRSRQLKESYYDHKRTSSKCVGGILEYNTGCAITVKLSPIIKTKSRTTSPKISVEQNNIEIGSNTIEKVYETTSTQFEIDHDVDDKKQHTKVYLDVQSQIEGILLKKISEQTQKSKCSNEIFEDKKKAGKKIDKGCSSDSLVQHVHNLESPSDDKNSRMSLDPMENKLEREYRKMFSTKSKDSKPSCDKPIPEFKSASILRRRFEALRRGLAKKEEIKDNSVIINNNSTQDSIHSRKDASVTSDPPSLEGKSYSNTKKFSPVLASVEQTKNRGPYNNSSRVPYNNDRDSSQCIRTYDSESQGVKGMFKLWGKKFNFEDECYKKRTTPMASFNVPAKSENEIEVNIAKPTKQEGRKFFFFKKKSKDKTKENKEPYKPNKDVTTAGRCEIRDGLTLNIPATPSPKHDRATNSMYERPATPKHGKITKISEEYDDISRRTWLRRFLSNTIESKRSVNVRWNNSMYATSSSTVFELLETVYKNTGVVIRSRSEITTAESSNYKSYTNNRANFVQDIEAWMIPKTIPDRPKEIPVRIYSNKGIKNRNCEVTVSDQKWFIDKSKAFSRNIEVVLHSENFKKVDDQVSSEYLKIDIPNDFFDSLSSDDSKQNPTSDEEVYKIVEYETDTDTRNKVSVKDLEKGGHESSEIKVIVSVQDSENQKSKILETIIKKPPTHRDVVIQGSNVNVPKRCDVIGVGIITQRDLREIRKPILKIQDDISDEDSERSIPQPKLKKCDFAESYLQEYYRHWTPLGIDLYSWCVSDPHLRSCSEKSIPSFHNQGDGSKSCPNIFDDFQVPAIISSCEHSSYGRCASENKQNDTLSSKVFQVKPSKAKNTAKNTSKNTTKNAEPDLPDVRVLPKDSLEVFKRRKLYAASNKSNWASADDKVVSVPSIQSKEAQNTMKGSPMIEKSILKPIPKKKNFKKHVSMPDSETMNNLLARQRSDKTTGILAFKGQSGSDVKGGSPKHATTKAEPPSEIPQPACKVKCEVMENPPCDEKNSPTCNVPARLTPPLDSPISSKRKLPCDQCLPFPREPPTPPPCPASLPRCNSNCQKLEICKSPTPSQFPSPKISHDCLTPCSSAGSSPIQSPKGTPRQSPGGSPRQSPKIYSPCSSCASSKQKPTKEKSPKQSPYILPPVCSECKPPQQEEWQEFPWPTKCQYSNNTLPKPDSKKNINKSSYMESWCSPPPQIPVKECKPDCANQKKFQNATQNCKSYTKRANKISGLFLKMRPLQKKICVKECSALGKEQEHGIIRLNSKERITIRLNQQSPSTEEIRGDQIHMKLKDEDGKTLLERRDYRILKPSVLEDMYKDSNLHRSSTPIIVRNMTETQTKEPKDDTDDTSYANLIEIQFKLRISQGDKTTDINIANEKDTKQEKNNEIGNATPKVYVANNEIGEVSEEINPINDINIKIVINNYKTKHSQPVTTKKYDEFSKKISEKFHTVSTGYSDTQTEQMDDKVYSIHRATIDLDSSFEKSKTMLSKSSKSELPSKEFTENELVITVSSHSAEQLPTDGTEDENDNCSKKDSLQCENTNTKESELADPNDTDDQDTTLAQITSNECNEHEIIKLNSKTEKKELLKQVLEKVNKTSAKSKDHISEWVHDMLKIILDSDTEDKNATSNELLKDVTYTSLKPNYFRNTESLNNYYKLDSNLSSINDSLMKSNANHPSMENNSDASKSSDSDANDVTFAGCMCSKVAERLNQCQLNIGCCCRVKAKQDEETNCDLRTDEDFLLLNYRTAEYVDVETQNSRYLSSKVNSLNVSIQSRNRSLIKAMENLKEIKNEVKDTEIDKKVIKTLSPHKSHIKECEMKKSNQNTVLGISDHEKVVLISENIKKDTLKTKRDKKHKKKYNILQAADVLQCYDTKKAVLEIYAEKLISDSGEHLVAKLPKFVCDKESEITRNYQQIATNSYKSVCKKNIVMTVEK